MSRSQLLVMPVLAALLVLATACQREREAGPLELTGHLFVFNYRQAQATLLFTLQPMRPLDETLLVSVSFENPQGGEAIQQRQTVHPGASRIALESRPLKCVRKDRPYAFTIKVTNDSGEELQEITGTASSNLDQSVLPATAPVIGPAYDRNPLAYDDAGNLIAGSMAGCPDR
ncbi:MAG: hypothetical protein WBO55_08520 [Rhizobiaceae bacterium]